MRAKHGSAVCHLFAMSHARECNDRCDYEYVDYGDDDWGVEKQACSFRDLFDHFIISQAICQVVWLGSRWRGFPQIFKSQSFLMGLREELLSCLFLLKQLTRRISRMDLYCEAFKACVIFWMRNDGT